jgi:hypothetical protein
MIELGGFPLPSLAVCLLAVALISTTAPAWPRPIRSWMILPALVPGVTGLALAVPIWVAQGPCTGMNVALVGATALMPAFWIARAPFPGLDEVASEPDDDDEDGGDGSEEPPKPSSPSDGVNWEEFERARLEWEKSSDPEPVSGRELVAAHSRAGDHLAAR